MAEDTRGLTYSDAGVDYEAIDPAKVMAQTQAAATGENLSRWGLRELGASRGESAFVWEEADAYRAFVLECLGTKPLVANATREITGRTYYDALAQDTVAMVVNDIAAVGAEPQVITAYWAVGSSDWFDDQDRMRDLSHGWRAACDAVGATWGGGETPVLQGILAPEAVDLAGACVGVIKPKDRLVLGDALAPGDRIVVLASSGIHANGLSLARAIADRLPDGYGTRLSDGSLYGEALLAPTVLYSPALRALREAGVTPHYFSNITGHGWRKVMRARRPLRYRIERLPEPGPLFDFLVRHGQLDLDEAYGSLNMGAGFAVYVPEDQAEATVSAAESAGVAAWDVGVVEAADRSVILEPLDITYRGGELRLRADVGG